MLKSDVRFMEDINFVIDPRIVPAVSHRLLGWKWNYFTQIEWRWLPAHRTDRLNDLPELPMTSRAHS